MTSRGGQRRPDGTGGFSSFAPEGGPEASPLTPVPNSRRIQAQPSFARPAGQLGRCDILREALVLGKRAGSNLRNEPGLLAGVRPGYTQEVDDGVL